MKTRDIIVLIAVLTVGGCASNDEVQQKVPVPIRLTASVSVEAKTRSVDSQGKEHVVMQEPATRGVQESAIASGEKVYVWGKEGANTSWTYLQAWDLTSDGSNNLSGTSKYYPLNGLMLTMAAVHGNFAETLTEGSTAIGTLTHSVEADQDAAGNYEKSDLLWGTVTGSDGDATKNIPFTHKLSKIEVTLTPGYGYTTSDLATAEVRLHNVKPSIGITTADGTLGSASGDAITITPRKNTSTGTYEAVIPSQTFANPDALISVTTNNLTLTPPATLTSTVPNTIATFNENTKYVYNLTVQTIPNLPPPVVGDYFYADGTWSTVYENTHGDVVGIVFSTEPSAIDRDAGFTHGYVLALNDCGNSAEYQWRNSNTATGIANSSDIDGHGNSFTAVLSGTTSSVVIAAVKADLDGRIRSYLVSQLSGYSSETFPAFASAFSYTPVPSKGYINNSGWYLPSIGQQWVLLNNFCNLSPNTAGSWPGVSETWRGSSMGDFYYNGKANATHAAVNNYLEKRLKTDVEATGNTAISYTPMMKNSKNITYWSSTEASASYAWEINNHYDTNILYFDATSYKTYGSGQNRFVRAVLAF